VALAVVEGDGDALSEVGGDMEADHGFRF
jgi:hypothetical protein